MKKEKSNKEIEDQDNRTPWGRDFNVAAVCLPEYIPTAICCGAKKNTWTEWRQSKTCSTR